MIVASIQNMADVNYLAENCEMNKVKGVVVGVIVFMKVLYKPVCVLCVGIIGFDRG